MTSDYIYLTSYESIFYCENNSYNNVNLNYIEKIGFEQIDKDFKEKSINLSKIKINESDYNHITNQLIKLGELNFDYFSLNEKQIIIKPFSICNCNVCILRLCKSTSS